MPETESAAEPDSRPASEPEHEDAAAAAAAPDAWISPSGDAAATPSPAQSPNPAPVLPNGHPAPAAEVSGPGQPVQPVPSMPGYYAGSMLVAPYPPEQVQAAVAARRKRKRVMWGVTAVVAAVAVATVGVIAATSGRSGNSVVSAVKCAPQNLDTCLIKPPSGARTLTSAPSWDQAVAPTTDQYGANFTTDVKGMGSESDPMLVADTEAASAHTDWKAVDGNGIDMVLFRFSSNQGAQTWNTTRNAEILAAYPGRSVAVDGDSTEKAHAAAKPGPDGAYHASYSAVVGKMVLNINYASQQKLDTSDLRSWAGTELASLRTAPAPAADPTAVPDGTQKIVCPNLHACLPSRPSGMSAWDSPTSSDWVSLSSLTPKQFATDFWYSKYRSNAQSQLEDAAVTGIAHTDWASAGASQQADIYLIQTVTQVGASSAYSFLNEEPNWGKGVSGVSFDTGVAGTDAVAGWYANKDDSERLRVGFVVAQIGNVVVFAYFFFRGSYNTSLTKKWLSATVNRILATAKQMPLGLPSLTPPDVKVLPQGTCPASGDCLMPLPAGAKDTTSSSAYTDTKSAGGYASAYEGASNAQFDPWLGADGFQSAEHRAWTASNGADADLVVLKFSSPTQAQASAMLEYAMGAQNERACTDRAVADALCVAAPVSSSDPRQLETVDLFAWKGNDEVRVDVTYSNAADLANAYAWLEQQLALLPTG